MWNKIARIFKSHVNEIRYFWMDICYLIQYGSPCSSRVKSVALYRHVVASRASECSWNMSIRTKMLTSRSRTELHRIVNSSVLQPIYIPGMSWFILLYTSAHHAAFKKILDTSSNQIQIKNSWSVSNYNTAMYLLLIKFYYSVVEIVIVISTRYLRELWNITMKERKKFWITKKNFIYFYLILYPGFYSNILFNAQ